MASFPYSYILDAVLLADINEVDQTTIDESASTNSQAQQTKKLVSSAQLLRMLRFIRFIKIIRLLRLAKLKVIFDKIEDFLQLSSTIAAILSFLQLSVLILFWSHWLGCIFHFVATNEDGGTARVGEREVLFIQTTGSSETRWRTLLGM